MARWFIDQEERIRADLISVHSELPGAMQLRAQDGDFIIACRADRIDFMSGGVARVIDYKTGSVPAMKQVEAGFFPQLTLQAAILMQGGFPGLAISPDGILELQYVKLSSKASFGEVTTLDLKPSSEDCIQAHLNGLASLLTSYGSADTSYLPRLTTDRMEDIGDYDHLSRRMEWILAG
jgi:ATP-dependent helicase/nuclease subunit B